MTSQNTTRLPLTAVVLTLNEEKHLERCLRSIEPLVSSIVVVDSGSIDKTAEIAAKFGAHFTFNAFENYSKQFNWALNETPIQTEWVLRIDADEYIPEESHAEIRRAITESKPDICGLTLKLKRVFMGRWLRYGTLGSIRLLRIWRKERGHCENRWMDEHIAVNGTVAHISAFIVDHNLNDIGWWTMKHVGYATREARDLTAATSNHHGAVDQENAPARISKQARAKRWLKRHIYARSPLGLRAMAYFIYRYLLRLGFLDGKEGFIFHVLQGFWYRFLVDVKIWELSELGVTRPPAARPNETT